MAKYSIESSTLTGLADKVRTLTGETSTLTPNAMGTQLDNANTEVNEQGDLLEQLEAAVGALPEGGAGGVELPELTNAATASDILAGKEAINGSGNKITGTIANKTSSDLTVSGATVSVPAGHYASAASKSVSSATQATPSVSIDSAGKITATATQTAGYVAAGTKTGTKQLTTQAAKTVTPTKSAQTAVAKNVYTTGAVTVGAIPAEYITTTDATATEEYVGSGKTYYANGSKKTGTFTLDNELSTQESKLAELATALQGKAAGSGSGGITPSGTIEITENGTFDVTNYAEANVNVSQSGGNSGNVGNCTINIIPVASTNHYIYAEQVDTNGVSAYNISRVYTGNRIMIIGRCGTVVPIMASNIKGAECTAGEIIYIKSGYGIAYKVPNTPNETIQITLAG